MSDDRPRRSWREIDRNKDRSSHRKEERPEGQNRGGRQKQSYRAALDRLFDSGKIADLVEAKTGEKKSGEKKSDEDNNRFKAEAKIRDAGDRDEVTKLVDAYLQKFGNELPDDLEILTRVLEHRNPTWQLEAMERIDTLLETETPKRTRAMLGQLKMIRDIGDEPEMVQLAKKLIEQLD
jgi:hypothetical protein